MTPKIKKKKEVPISTPKNFYAAMATHYIDMQRLLFANFIPYDKDENRNTRRNSVKLLSKTVEEIISLLNPEIVLEIGAHEASFSKRLAKNLPESRIIAFEANPDVYSRHYERVSKCGVEFLNACVADRAGNIDIKIPIKNDNLKMTMGSILSDSWADSYKTYNVPSIILDEYLDKFPHRNAMWIDVEGAVQTVLNGAHKTLKNCVALFVELETAERWPGQALAHDIISILTDAGLVPLLADNQREWQFNALFVKPEVMDDPRIEQCCIDYIELMQPPELQP